jgi:lysine 6-dehydrogenase
MPSWERATGTAAAYDMIQHGGGGRVVLADADGSVARKAAERINRLVGREVASGVQLDARDFDALVDFLEPVDVYLCAVPYRFIPACTQAAIQAGTHMVDLGGHTQTVLNQLKMEGEARARGVAIVPDCGMGPGLNNTMGLYTAEKLAAEGATPREVRIWDGGLPVDPPKPWGYQCSFHINGLTNEYSGQAVFLRDGKITLVETFTELEEIEFEGLGKLEAFVASGGTSTVPYTYEGQFQVYEKRSAAIRAIRPVPGLQGPGPVPEEPIELIPARCGSPARVLPCPARPQVEVERVVDICVMRARASPRATGATWSFEVDIVDGYDAVTGFTGMDA